MGEGGVSGVPADDEEKRRGKVESEGEGVGVGEEKGRRRAVELGFRAGMVGRRWWGLGAAARGRRRRGRRQSRRAIPRIDPTG